MSNKNGRALEKKADVRNALEQMFPGSSPVKPTVKQQAMLDRLAATWFAAQQQLSEQQALVEQFAEREKENKAKLLGAMEAIAQEYDVDFARLNWAFDGKRLIMAVPK